MVAFEVRLGGHSGQGAKGNLTLSSSGMRFEGKESDKKVEVKQEDVEGMEWGRIGKSFQLRVSQSDGSVVRFDGFDSAAEKSIAEYATKTMKTEMKKMKTDVQGKNFGQLEMHGDELVFKVGSKRLLDVTLSDVSNAQVSAQKDEIVLEFTQPDVLRKKEEHLLEMRFFVPDTEPVVEDEEEESAHKRTCENLHADILKYVTTISGGDQLAKMEDVKFRVPRGTFELQLFTKVFKLHGVSFDFTIKYRDIKEMALVPTSQGNSHLLLLSLDPPYRKGATIYPNLVCLFNETETEEPTSLPVSLPADFLAKYKDHPPKMLERMKPAVKSGSMEGSTTEIMTRLLQFFASTDKRNLKIHKVGKFESEAGGGPFIRCSIGANLGSLYLLDECFVFLEKPALIFMYEKVSEIVFERQKNRVDAAQSKTFDFKIKMTDGKSQEFNLIPKKELKNLERFFTAISAGKFDKKKMRIANYNEDEEEEDGLGGDSSGDSDAGIKNRVAAGGGSDSDSEDDGDFQGGKSSDGGSPSDSSEDDSDEGGGGGGSDGEGGGKKSKKDKKKSKKERREKEPKKSKKETKEKKPVKPKKDPNAPKKGKSSYFIFADDKRPELKELHPEWKITEFGSALGKMWKDLTDEEKAPYTEKAKVLAEEYKVKIAEYHEQNPDAAEKFKAAPKEKGEKKKRERKSKAVKKEAGSGSDSASESDGAKEAKKKKVKKDPNAPKGPLTAFMLFSKNTQPEIREKNPEMKITDVAKEVGQRWGKLLPDDKEEWTAKAREDKTRFEDEMKIYNAKKEDEEESGVKKEEESDGDDEKPAGDVKMEDAKDSDSDSE